MFRLNDVCNLSTFWNVSCWLQCDLAVDDCDPEPFKNTEIGEGTACFTAFFSFIKRVEGRNEVAELLLLLFFGKCVQRTILEDDGEVVPTICTALPKHCALA